jgi:hypothetical protein
MNYITNVDGGDGFGSQFLSRISGMAYANHHKLNYVHYPIKTLVLEDNPSQSRTDELDVSNKLLNDIMLNLEIKNVDELNSSDTIDAHCRVDFYREIISNPSQYFNEEWISNLQNSYIEKPPSYYQNEKLNIAIHIRRGNDISINDSLRYVSSDLYNDIITKLLEKYEDSIIHIFSWNDPQINVNSNRIVYHTTSDGGKEFINDFNALVHADILLVGSSTFSISAGFFNKNIVLYNKKISRIDINPFIPIWETNFENIIGQF